ncbi:unnamed protein product [Heligmosomoides polygyrus]|uniref:Uncharacterized protein n=1 Tax=Heligmosomoides polygyrus TaxID=6339 RepID=A0A183FY59_HELPZ|nr:unnamed protein product [Heligmosomoides polygyrus]
MLLESQESEFGFDTDVEEIKASNEESVYDASRNKTKAQTAPSLRSDLAQSKPVNNMSELASVVSIVLEPFWSGRCKEEELLLKDSKHLTILGLAHTPHRSSCYKLNSTLRTSAGKRIVLYTSVNPLKTARQIACLARGTARCDCTDAGIS